MVSLALVAELESLRFAATLGSTSQRLNLQVGQVVNCARDILRYNGSTLSRNAPTSFRAESTLHGSFPKIPRLAGASRHRNVPPKEVCKYQYREDRFHIHHILLLKTTITWNNSYFKSLKSHVTNKRYASINSKLQHRLPSARAMFKCPTQEPDLGKISDCIPILLGFFPPPQLLQQQLNTLERLSFSIKFDPPVSLPLKTSLSRIW